MNPFARLGCRIYQGVLYVASAFLPFRLPQEIEGEEGLAKAIAAKGLKKPLIVTDRFLHSIGMEKKVEEALTKLGLDCATFSDVDQNPTFSMVEAGYRVYQERGCDCLIGLGGGSSIDAAKVLAVRIAYPRKELSKFKGILKIHRKLVPIYAIPTTAGTGSEATLAAVIINDANRDKFQIDDPKLIPLGAVFDPSLLSGLPSKIVAATGMDALTHAVESYIGHSNVRSTKRDALEAIALIDAHLLKFYENPGDTAEAREMQRAAFLAGAAFTRAYVGYVHALAHSLGGTYNVPHGFANAVLLPHVLKAYGPSAYKKLAELCDHLHLISITSTREEKAKAFIAYVERLNATMHIPRAFEDLVREEDIPALVAHAAKEGNPLYPVPKLMNAHELESILRSAIV